ncbi:lysosomal acid glucosylceramidase [Phlebotomus argentipes]|uniref:lysosomal acid glucosylceramidase n=1 Tax=Phlebotomus argentipes TaxID=94469 RepID=UPI0028931611|nr:lysosomal acid glucosylceramidase [Phlebotomus argentipes]
MALNRNYLLSLMYLAIVRVALLSAENIPCNLREYQHGFVCVCNKTNCDFLEESVDNPNESELVIVSSSQAGLRFDVSKFTWPSESSEVNIRDYAVKPEPQVLLMSEKAQNYNWASNLFGIFAKNDASVSVDLSKKYQKVVGFGGAFTGSVAHNLDQISQELQDFLYRSYYSSAGIGYNFMRIPIGGCDFDLEAWAYNEVPQNDAKLTNFTELDARDLRFIDKLRQLQSASQNSNIKIMASAWSPPPWMKSNNKWSGASSLKKQYYQTWADYHLRYIELMSRNGVDLWGITTGNEPMNGVIGFLFVHFMSLGWTAGAQGSWVADHLGPTVKNSPYSDVKIFAGDDQRYTFPWWFNEMKTSRPNVMDYVDGFAVHWYWDRFVPAAVLDSASDKFPEKLIINTESCIGDKPLQTHGPILGSWDRAEEYILAYIEDLQHSVNGWIDWNLLLNEDGGPNYVSNHVESAVIVNKTSDEAYKQPLFYAIGHFSRFIPEGSVRVLVTSTDSQVHCVGFERADSKIVVIMYNKRKNPVKMTLNVPSRTPVNLSIPAKSIHSVIFTKTQ